MHELEPELETAEDDPQRWWEADAAVLGPAAALDVAMYWARRMADWSAGHDPRVAGADLEAVRTLLGLAVYRSAQLEGVADPGGLPTLMPMIMLSRSKAPSTAAVRPLGHLGAGRLRLADRERIRAALADPDPVVFETLRKETVMVLVSNTDHARTVLGIRSNDSTVWTERPLIPLASRHLELPDADLAWDWYGAA
ncbi:hypothetical protein ACIGXM_11725 [Kitasatospora sp. NPDC052896]|uniref:hypothetical protein n=1 Tax=Kitasatospora sp. NPDC052896 TaxID=3364061 RepID=UPI0037CA514E